MGLHGPGAQPGRSARVCLDSTRGAVVWCFADRGEVWTFLGFPTYGGRPFEHIGIDTTVPLLALFLLVGAAEAAADGCCGNGGARARCWFWRCCRLSSPTGPGSRFPLGLRWAGPHGAGLAGLAVAARAPGPAAGQAHTITACHGERAPLPSPVITVAVGAGQPRGPPSRALPK
jgi:hypothetical protein